MSASRSLLLLSLAVLALLAPLQAAHAGWIPTEASCGSPSIGCCCATETPDAPLHTVAPTGCPCVQPSPPPCPAPAAGMEAPLPAMAGVRRASAPGPIEQTSPAAPRREAHLAHLAAAPCRTLYGTWLL